MNEKELAIEKIKNDGYAVIENVLTTEEASMYASTLNNLYANLVRQQRNVYPDGVGLTERLVVNLHNKDPKFLELLNNNIVFPIVKECFSAGSYHGSEPIIVSQFTARDPHITAPEQQLHIDSRLPGSPHPLQIIALYMLNDFSVETGATRAIPKSHLFSTFPIDGKTYDTEVRIEAPAGSVLLFNSSLWHGGGKKLVDVERWSIIVSYARWFLKPSFDMTKNTPAQIYNTLSDEMKILLGFTTVPPSDEFLRARTRISIDQLPKQI